MKVLSTNDERTLLALQDGYFLSTGRERVQIFNQMYSLIKKIAKKMIHSEMGSRHFFIDADMVDEHSNYIAYRVLRKLFHQNQKRTGFTAIIYQKTFETLHNRKQRKYNEEIYNYIIYEGKKML